MYKVEYKKQGWEYSWQCLTYNDALNVFVYHQWRYDYVALYHDDTLLKEWKKEIA